MNIFLKGLLLFFISSVLVFCKRSVSSKDPEERRELEMSIVHGINIPFKNTDTVFIIPTELLICGNPLPEQEFLDKIYTSRLDSGIYLRELAKNLRIPVMVWSDENHLKTDSLADPIQGHRFYRNKTFITLNGRILSGDSVRIYEQYWNFEKNITVEKLFLYSNKHWGSVIIKETERFRN